MAFRDIKRNKPHIPSDLHSSPVNFGSRVKITSPRSKHSRSASSTDFTQQKDRPSLYYKHSNIPRLNSLDEISHNDTEHSYTGLEDLCKIRDEHNQELIQKCEELKLEVLKERELRKRAEIQLAAYNSSEGTFESLRELSWMLENKDALIQEISKERDFLKKEVIPVLEHTIKLYDTYRQQMEQELETKNKELELMRNTENSLEDPILETDEEDSVQTFNFDLFFSNQETTDPQKVTRSLCSSPIISLPRGFLASRPISSMKSIIQNAQLTPKSSTATIISSLKPNTFTRLSTVRKSSESSKKKFTPSFLRAPKVTESTHSRAHKVLSFPTKKAMSARQVCNNT